MKLDFVQKDGNKAYVSNHLYLPKAMVRSGPIKSALEFDVTVDGKQSSLQLWEESSKHLICPREFLNSNDYPNYNFPFVDLTPEFPTVEFEDCVIPRDEEQERATRSLYKNDNGLFVLACGKGKTKLAQKKIAQKKTPTLVIVPDGGIMSQWVESIDGAEGKPPGLKFDGRMGMIQGPTFDWQRPLTLALVTTLALRIKEGRVPEEMYRHFGLILYDEVHRIGAPFFSTTAWPFFGDRIGLTATWQREDGLDPVYRYHIGEPFYSDLVQELIPTITFEQTPATFDYADCQVGNVINISLLRSKLGMDWSATAYRYWRIKQALDAGRKILCLSHSKAQLKILHAVFPDSGLILGATPKDERMSILRSHQLTFAISKLGSEGVDDDALESLFWLTPFKSKISLQQSMGRVQRARVGKKHPEVVFFQDSFIHPLRGLCTKLKTTLKEWRFQFLQSNPQQFPTWLPEEVRENYVRARADVERTGDEQDPDREQD
jgi:hypothetical protein